jgi:hypothetical protein
MQPFSKRELILNDFYSYLDLPRTFIWGRLLNAPQKLNNTHNCYSDGAFFMGLSFCQTQELSLLQSGKYT